MSSNVPLPSEPGLVYDTMLFFWRMVTAIFFREIRPRGAYNIPTDGPVIFVAAPHSNQVRTVRSCNSAWHAPNAVG